jgi:hypothetical protein
VINLQILLADGTDMMIYDVHPRSQFEAVPLPANAVGVVVWLGVKGVTAAEWAPGSQEGPRI